MRECGNAGMRECGNAEKLGASGRLVCPRLDRSGWPASCSDRLSRREAAGDMRQTDGRTRRRALTCGALAVLVTSLLVPLSAAQATSPAPPSQVQPPPAPAGASSSPSPRPAGERLVHRVPAGQFATLRLSNREIVTFRASIVPRDPAERAEGAERALARLVEAGVTGPVAARPLLGAAVVTVGGRDVFALVPDDVDEASDDDLTALTAATIVRLQTALKEAEEARAPTRLLWATLRALGATGLLLLVLITLFRVHRVIAQRLWSAAEAGLSRTGVGKDAELMRTSWLLDLVRRLVRIVAFAMSAVAVYSWVTFVLQQFPVTRPWGEALGGYLALTLRRLGWSAITALPGLFTVVLIFFITRVVVRIAGLLFDSVEQGRLPVTGLHGPRVVTTRRIVTTLLWLFAVVVAYPYLPGSSTEAFKGVSVFVGLVVSLGSTGVVNQLMSGFMLTYSDALAPGEYVRVGQVEGTVTSLGVLSTKIRTLANEEVTLPNAVVISGTTTNYSRHAAEGVFAGTTVTIGYDTPWRQVEALLLLAASRTPGLREDRPPFVLQTSLADFYVEYRLVVCVAEPTTRMRTLATLHAQIQDAFNEHGVQIMSPHYEQDPEGAKVVPRARWYDPPARAPQTGTAGRTTMGGTHEAAAPVRIDR